MSTATVAGITVTQSGSPGGVENYQNQTFDNGSYWVNPYTGTVPGAPSLRFATAGDPNDSRNITVTFSKPVDNPVLHVARLGGVGTVGNQPPTSNTSIWTLVDSVSQSGPVTLTRLSGNQPFQVLDGNRFQREPNVQNVQQVTTCRTDSLGNACGSIRFNGIGITRLTFQVTSAGIVVNNSRGDGLNFVWSFEGTRVTVRKQSVGTTGTYAFSHANLKNLDDSFAGNFNLDTASSNPASSAQYKISNNAQAVTITETIPAGQSLTASCVNDQGGTVNSSLSGDTLTIPADAYAGNEQLTCTFVNSKRPTVQATKITQGGVGTFRFSGSNGIAQHDITTTAEGAGVSGPVQTLAETGIGTDLIERLDPDYHEPEVECRGLGEGGSYQVSLGLVHFDAAATAAGAAIQCTFVNRRKLPELVVEKTADRATISAPGKIAYTITVRNTGDGKARDISVTDTLPDGRSITLSGPAGDGGDDPDELGVLDPGETWTYTAEYDATQEDIDAGETLVNTVKVASSSLPGREFTDTAETSIQRNPGLSVVKTVDKQSTDTVGDTLSYTIVVRNTGNVTLNDVTLTDTLPDGSEGNLSGGAGCDLVLPLSTTEGCPLAPGESWTYTITYTVTQADLDAGADLVNKVDVTSSETPAPASDTAVTQIHRNPALSIDKVVDKATTTSAGDVLTYTITARNIGNVGLENVQINDTLPDGSSATLSGPSGDANGNGILDIDEEWTWTTAYSVSQADIDAGNELVNRVVGTADGAPPASDRATTGVATRPGIDIEKDVDRDSISGPGVLNYTVTVTNTGNVTLNDVVVTDTMPDGTVLQLANPSGDAGTIGALDVGEVWVYTATYTVTQQDMDAGADIVNRVTVTAEDPNGQKQDSDSSATTINQMPRIAVEKEVDRSTIHEPGMLTYTVRAQNTGNVSLQNVTLDDSLSNGGNVTVGAPSESGAANGVMEVEEVWSWTVTYEVSQEDIDAGDVITNSATVRGTSQDGTQASSTDTADTRIEQSPSLAIEKSVDKSSTAVAGDVLDYTIRITNTGNIAQTGIIVTDLLPDGSTGTLDGPSGDGGVAGTLEVGESWTYTISYTVTQDQIDAGADLVNEASVRSDQVTTPVVDSATTTIHREPKLSILKRQVSGPNPVTAADQVIGYEIVIENFGNVTQTNIVVTDTLPDGTPGQLSGPSGDGGVAGALDVGEIWTYTVSYTVTQADIDAGAELVNNASARSDQVTTPVTASAATSVAAEPGIELVKTAGAITDANGSGRTDAGDTIAYTLTVRNTGSVTLNSITVSDPRLGITASPTQPATLAPGESGTAGPFTYTLTQADIDAGKIDNAAQAHGKDAQGNDVTDDAAVSTPVVAASAMTVAKSAGQVADANGDGRDSAGDTIAYTITVRNTGSLSIDDATVTDSKLGISNQPVSPATLAPGEEGTAGPFVYTLTQADIDAGKVDNVAQGSATDRRGSRLDGEARVSTPIAGSPGIKLTKTAGAITDANGDGKVNAGDTITYSFEVENTGSVTVSNVAVDDARLGVSDLAVTPGTLAPGEKGTASATYTLTQADMDAGKVDNSASARGKAPDGAEVSADATVSMPIAASPAITLTKTAGAITDANGDGKVNAGDTITYSFEVENTGSVTVSNVAVDDAKLGVSGLAVTPGTLAPGEKGIASATYTLTQADMDAGKVDNSASARGKAPDGAEVTADATVSTPIAASPAITLTKTAGAITDANGDGKVNAGDTITYSFEVENTGSVTVSNVTVDDAKLGVSGLALTPGTLAPGEKGTASATYTLTQADMDVGKVDNSASARGKAPDGAEVSADATVSTPVAASPAITLTKTAGAITDANGDGKVNAGDTITYSFEVENTGSVTVSNVAVDDARLGVSGLAVTPGTLAPGEKGTASATYTLTQADVDAGKVDNSASARGEAPDGAEVTADATVSTPVAASPAIALTKTAGAITDANGDGKVNAGDTITYSFEVENTGSVTVSNVAVDDAKLGVSGLAVTPGTLAPGEKGTASATYTLTLADMDAGKVDNSASARGKAPDGAEVSADATVSTPIAASPAITLTKTAGAITDANGDGKLNAGDTITYTFTVENTGPVTVTEVAVDDPKLGLAGLVVNPATLAPRETGTATATYALTQADIDAGKVDNTARAEAKGPDGASVDDEVTVSTVVAGESALKLTKTAGSVADANGNGRTDAGDTIAYTLTVEYTGSVTVSDITVTDAKLGIERAAVSPSTLAPGASATAGPFTYTLTQADLDAGRVDNTASTSGRAPSGSEVGDEAGVSVPVVGVAGIAIEKTAGEPSGQTVGSTLTYRFKVTNTGSVGLTN